jgi:hypothetical protein
MYKITTIKLKFSNNTTMVCVSLPNDTFKYFSSRDYKTLLATQRAAHKFVESLK